MSGCWLWGQRVDSNDGYGRFRFGTPGKDGRQPFDRAHRVSWKIYNGEIPSEKCVLHKCDNRICVNPDHLYIGTRKNNRDDCVEKGRFPKALSEGQVLHIRKKLMSQVGYAKLYGVAKSTVAHAQMGKSYKHFGGLE